MDSFEDILGAEPTARPRRRLLKPVSGGLAWIGGALLAVVGLVLIVAVVALCIGAVLWLLVTVFSNWDIASTGNWQYENQQWGK